MKAKPQEIFKRADCICFDFDSTICKEEGIDVLAKYYGKEDLVKNITEKAMNGMISFEESLKNRLDIIKPTMAGIKNILDTQPFHLNDGIQSLLEKLKQKNPPCDIYVISGGFQQIIYPIVKKLGISPEKTVSNILLFDSKDNYIGLDNSIPTCVNEGKLKAIQNLIDNKGFKSVVMIGDGVTDLETKPLVDLFIGYGGSVIRDKIKAESDLFVMSFFELLDILK